MRLTRVYAPLTLTEGSEAPLPAGAANHLVRVLRLEVGDELVVFDGMGNEHHALLTHIAGSQAAIKIGAAIVKSTESNLHVTLVQGISRGERMDWTLQKATELGIRAITPLLTSRSVVRLDEQQAAKKQQHWQQVVISACEQSGRSVVPNLAIPQTLRNYLNQLQASALRLTLSPYAKTSLAQMPMPTTPIELLIGPEGGLDEAEIELAEQRGFVSVRLGPRVLRTETAAMATLAAMQSLWGDFR